MLTLPTTDATEVLNQVEWSATEQEVASHANKGSSANSDSSHLVGTHVVFRMVLPIMVFGLCTRGQ
jgi:hypothetical protein